jgi:hypothetical protein
MIPVDFQQIRQPTHRDHENRVARAGGTAWQGREPVVADAGGAAWRSSVAWATLVELIKD